MISKIDYTSNQLLESLNMTLYGYEKNTFVSYIL